MTSYIAPRSKLFRHLDRLQEIQQGKKPAPINVELDFSLRCDLACAGCHFAYTHTRGPWAGKAEKPEGAIPGGDLIDYDLACDIFEQLAAYGVKSLTLTGGGEPTIHPRFDDMIRHAHGAGLELGIYTHGGFIRGDRAEWMKRHFEWIYFSLDGHDVESYKAYKGVNRFERVCDNIRQLVAMEGNATIGVGFLIHNDNWRAIHDMVRLGRDLGVDYVQFRPTVHYDQAQPGKMVEADTAWIHHAIGRLQAYEGDRFVIADTSRFLRYAQWQEDKRGYSTCWWANIQTVITPNGKVWRCTNKREYPDGLLGDLTVESFETLWQRSGGACAVTSTCRLACRGDISNQTLDAVMAPTVHSNFV